MMIKLGRGLSPVQKNTSPPIFASAQKAVLIGDSITNANIIAAPDIYIFSAAGWFTNYNALMNNRFELPVENNIASAGDTTLAQLSDINGGALDALEFDVAFILSGTNDLPIRTASDIAGTLEIIIDKIINDYSVPVVVLTILHRNDGGDAHDTKINDLNALIRAFDTRGGMLMIADTDISWNDGNDDPKVGASSDGLHPTLYGAYLVGKDIKTQTLSFFGAGSEADFAGALNLLSNGTMSGTSGTLGSNASGVVADNFTLSGLGGTGGRVGSKNPDNSQRIDYDTITSYHTPDCALSQTVSGGFSVGDTVYGLALIEVIGTPEYIFDNRLTLTLSGTGIPTLDTVRGFQGTGTELIPEGYESGIGRYLIVTPDLPITSGTGLSLEWKYQIIGNGMQGNPKAVVNVIGAGIFKRELGAS